MKSFTIVFILLSITALMATYNTSAPFAPNICGTSYEVLEMKVRHGKYPKGYKPKRSTSIMPRFPHLTDEELKAIHAYLNSDECKRK